MMTPSSKLTVAFYWSNITVFKISDSDHFTSNALITWMSHSTFSQSVLLYLNPDFFVIIACGDRIPKQWHP